MEGDLLFVKSVNLNVNHFSHVHPEWCLIYYLGTMIQPSFCFIELTVLEFHETIGTAECGDCTQTSYWAKISC